MCISYIWRHGSPAVELVAGPPGPFFGSLTALVFKTMVYIPPILGKWGIL